jgi:hypothetical protein
MLERRKVILRLLYDERERSPVHTLTVEDFASKIAVSRNEAWNDLEYLQQSGFLTISDREIAGRVFYSFDLTPQGLDFAENTLYASAAYASPSLLPPLWQGSSADRPPRVFVSHSSVDTEFCDRMVAYLRDTVPRVDLFYDATSLEGGDAWVKRIPREILACPDFVVVLSPNAVESSWVQEEAQLALREAITTPRRRIIPVLRQPCDINLLSPFLTSRQVIDCSGGYEQSGFARLARTMRDTQ